ncbi:hypothetical protein BDR26DRAFT_960845 [Obelidium mucronatum]|nr:hypothetical protein BDR26DRAFT_960845 [Obelidium mucronatum]
MLGFRRRQNNLLSRLGLMAQPNEVEDELSDCSIESRDSNSLSARDYDGDSIYSSDEDNVSTLKANAGPFQTFDFNAPVVLTELPNPYVQHKLPPGTIPYKDHFPCHEDRKSHRNVVFGLSKLPCYRSNKTHLYYVQRQAFYGKTPPQNPQQHLQEFESGVIIYSADNVLELVVLPGFLDWVYNADHKKGVALDKRTHTLVNVQSQALSAFLQFTSSFPSPPQPTDVRHKNTYQRFGCVFHIGMRVARGQYKSCSFDGNIVPAADCSNGYKSKAYSQFRFKMAPVMQAIGLLHEILAPVAYTRDRAIVNYYAKTTKLEHIISCSREVKLMRAIPVCDAVCYHYDRKDDGDLHALSPMTVFGYYSGGDLLMPGLSARIKYPSGTYVLTRPRILEHKIETIEGPSCYSELHEACLFFKKNAQSKNWTMSLDEVRMFGVRFGFVNYNENIAATHATRFF